MFISIHIPDNLLFLQRLCHGSIAIFLAIQRQRLWYNRSKIRKIDNSIKCITFNENKSDCVYQNTNTGLRYGYSLIVIQESDLSLRSMSRVNNTSKQKNALRVEHQMSYKIDPEIECHTIIHQTTQIRALKCFEKMSVFF